MPRPIVSWDNVSAAGTDVKGKRLLGLLALSAQFADNGPDGPWHRSRRHPPGTGNHGLTEVATS
jgi:hypothetical protein